MPPSRHSSSSHSSRSSSSRSSSRSSSSRSSYSSSRSSSSRGPSSHSSSSYSSRPSSFFGRSSSSPGPSRHSSGSFGSAPAPQSGGRDWRPRVNQPTGFVSATHRRPVYYYGRKHSYAYYPEDWTDAETGASYQKGYYDENGQRYENVAFEEDGKYKSVVCGCPYCGLDTILDLGADAAAGHSLRCPNCGGPMEICSELDTILSEVPENTHVYDSEESLKNAFPQKRKKTRLWPFVLALMLVFSAVNRVRARLRPEPVQQLPTTVSSGSTLSLAPFGDHLYLEKQEDGSYHVVTDVLRADKLLDYERDSDNYYDEASDCWLWYNREVEPAVWQYWYEGVSSDFGDYGWMEHADDGWHIEASEGNWIPLPEKYDASGLWYIG